MTKPTWDIGDRHSGKTTRLIEKAYDENLYIITPNINCAQSIHVLAERMGKHIMYPITLGELPMKLFGNPYCMTHQGVLVDDVEVILEMLIGMPVLGATACGKVLSPDSSMEETEDVSTQNGIFKCKACGCTVEEDGVDYGMVNYCPDCGKWVSR